MRTLSSLLFGAAVVLTSTAALAAPERLLLTEVVVNPNGAEYIAIHNPGATAIDLTNYYIADFAAYYKVADATPTAPGDNDFVARFPAGASIAGGATQYISLGGAECFKTACGTVGAFVGFGIDPTYEFVNSDATKNSATVPDMLAPFTDAIGGQKGITNTGEPIILFYWEAGSALVTDIDYVVVGNPSSSNAPVNKTGISTYKADTTDNATLHAPLSTGGSTTNTCRTDMSETGQTPSGGNGVNGTDQTSEPNATNWVGCVTTSISVTPDGGTGGSGTGGTGTGGTGTGGTGTGGTGTGGTGTGGTGTGGTGTGGTGVGGTGTGGTGVGGTGTGGTGVGGTGTGGTGTGGTGTGGTATGGSGGSSTGGSGGSSTGGSGGSATGGMGGSGTGGKGGSGGSATGGKAGSGTGGKAGSTTPAAVPQSEDDGGCQMVANSNASGIAALLFGLAGAVALTRRRRTPRK